VTSQTNHLDARGNARANAVTGDRNAVRASIRRSALSGKAA
jgi:hypothetical protein